MAPEVHRKKSVLNIGLHLASTNVIWIWDLGLKI